MQSSHSARRGLCIPQPFAMRAGESAVTPKARIAVSFLAILLLAVHFVDADDSVVSLPDGVTAVWDLNKVLSRDNTFGAATRSSGRNNT